MPVIDRPGARVAYTVSGSGPPLILGHSLFCTRAMWDGVLERLEGYTVINVELRGHGESTATAPFDLWDLVDDWTAILDAEGHNVAVCGGLSTGGFTGMRMALKFPQRVRGLVLFDTASEGEPRMQQFQYGFLGWLYQTTGVLPVKKLAKSMFGSYTRQHVPQRVSELITEVRQFDRRQLGHAMSAVFGRQSVDLSQIRLPTLIAVGEEDQATPPHQGRQMAGQIAGSELHLIPKAGHLSAVEQPNTVAQLMIDFLPKCWSDAKPA